MRTGGASSLVNYWWGADITKSTGGVNLADGSWHHVMATFDGTTRKLYVDGTDIGSDTPTGLAVTKTDNFCVGCVHLLSLACSRTHSLLCRSSNNGEYFTGQMRNIRVWNKHVQPDGNTNAAGTGVPLTATCPYMYAHILCLLQIPLVTLTVDMFAVSN